MGPNLELLNSAKIMLWRIYFYRTIVNSAKLALLYDARNRWKLLLVPIAVLTANNSYGFEKGHNVRIVIFFNNECFFFSMKRNTSSVVINRLIELLYVQYYIDIGFFVFSLCHLLYPLQYTDKLGCAINNRRLCEKHCFNNEF